jgi:ribosomal protein S18 acetylase RimI-like enzyme
MTTPKKDMPIQIRKLSKSDENAILQVYIGCEDFLALGPVATASMEMVRKDFGLSLQEGGEYCGIFSETGEMIGIVDYVPGNYKGNPEIAFLSLLMIVKPYRSGGIGHFVVEIVEKTIRSNKAVKAILSGVQVNNPRAIEFWQKNGYRIIRGPITHPDRTTAYDLRKDLIA